MATPYHSDVGWFLNYKDVVLPTRVHYLPKFYTHDLMICAICSVSEAFQNQINNSNVKIIKTQLENKNNPAYKNVLINVFRFSLDVAFLTIIHST